MSEYQLSNTLSTQQFRFHNSRTRFRRRRRFKICIFRLWTIRMYKIPLSYNNSYKKNFKTSINIFNLNHYKVLWWLSLWSRCEVLDPVTRGRNRFGCCSGCISARWWRGSDRSSRRRWWADAYVIVTGWDNDGSIWRSSLVCCCCCGRMSAELEWFIK